MPMQKTRKTISTFASFISRLLFRTRPSERLTEELTVRDLEKLSRYDGTLPYADKRVRALVWEVKYYKDSRAAQLAGEYLAQLLLAEASDVVGTPLLIPMPMHPKRRRERGHNQTEVLCEAALGSSKTRIKKVLGPPPASEPEGLPDFFYAGFAYAPDILQRTRHTRPQQGLERHNRLQNLKDSMQVADPAKVKGRVCIVVDDVSTTGASFAEAKRALKAAGAAEVRCIALAQS
jgi:predicted amidophosphoribosyltransferase